jgi:hypothetical protein
LFPPLLDDRVLGLIANLSEPIERFHLTINFMIDPPITGGSSPFGGLLPSYCLVVVGENGHL